MKKRILSILLTLCMVLMLVPATVFAEEEKDCTIKYSFKYGSYQGGSGNLETSPYTYAVYPGDTCTLGTVIDCAPYKFVGWCETGSGTVYAPRSIIESVASNLTFEAVYELDPSLGITIDGPDEICAHQNYFFTATALKGVALDKFWLKYGIDNLCYLTLGQEADGTAWGVVQTDYYGAGSFELKVDGKTVDGSTVFATKTVQISPEHIYVDGVCGCGAKLEYTITYDGGEDSEGSIAAGTKNHGENYTLSTKAFTRDGYVQIGWEDKEGNRYDLGGTYTQDADMTFYPVWDEILTLSVPYTTTIKLGSTGVPGKTTFDLAMVGANAAGESYTDVIVSGSVTTNGAGDYNSTLTLTGPSEQLRNMLCEGAFVKQVNAGKAGWTYDDTVWGLYMPEAVELAVADDSISDVIVVPAQKDAGSSSGYIIDWDNMKSESMRFTNTYTKKAATSTKNDSVNGKGYTPETGDNSHMALWLALILAGLSLFAAAGINTGKKRM